MTELAVVPAAAPKAVDLEEVETRDLIAELESRGHEVDNEADLEDFSDEDLTHELQTRGMAGAPLGTYESIVEMFEAFYLGKSDAAIALARRIAQDTTGRFLP
jgi:hypothetical protein